MSNSRIYIQYCVLQTKYGDLGIIDTNKIGRAEFRLESERVKVWDVIGRSIVIRDTPHTQQESDKR